jgi:fluoride exporter
MLGSFLVFLGAGLGGLLRHGVNVVAMKSLGPAFPFGTLTVNVVGSLVMGVLAGWLAFKAQAAWSTDLRLFLMTGILGGFTTFSAFSLDAVLLYERGEFGTAAAYVLVSVILSIGALVAGLSLMRALA